MPIVRLLPCVDVTLQQLALDCLISWKHQCLPIYSPRLRSLLVDKQLKETLTVWDVSTDSDYNEGQGAASSQGGKGGSREEGGVRGEDRGLLFPVVIRLVWPKLKNPRGYSHSAQQQVRGLETSVRLAELAWCREAGIN